MDNQIIKCPKCGAENPEGKAFCSDCGAQLMQQQTNMPAPVKKKLKWWHIVLIAFGCFIIIGSIFNAVNGNSNAASSVPAIASSAGSKANVVSSSSSNVTSSESGYITKAKFLKIQTGMSYDEVKKIVGSEGTLLSETGSKDSQYHTVIYDWKAENGIANATFGFQDGKLMTKAQTGLN